MNEKLKQIKKILETNGRRIYFKEKDGEILFSTILDEIVKQWKELNEKDQENIAEICVGEQPKHYLGNDLKWQLYSYVCDLGGDEFTIRCGKYAYSKIKNINMSLNRITIPNFIEYLELNGEQITVLCCEDLDKKQIIISNKDAKYYFDDSSNLNNKYIHEIEPDDIVLYFA